MGLGDSVWPAPRACTYPTLLNDAAPDVIAYPPEAVIAEKVEAMVQLGDRNSRIKDFFDLQFFARSFEFDRPTLVEAVRRTFARRRTPIPEETPIGLTAEYWKNPSRPAQVAAFARRSRLAASVSNGSEILEQLAPFLLPIFEDLRSGGATQGSWPPGGPWK